MGLLGSLLKTTFDIVTIPVDIVSDVITLGGAVNETESAIGRKIDKLSQDGRDIRNSCDDI